MREENGQTVFLTDRKSEFQINALYNHGKYHSMHNHPNSEITTAEDHNVFNACQESEAPVGTDSLKLASVQLRMPGDVFPIFN